MTTRTRKVKYIAMWGFILVIYATSLVSSYTAGRQRMFYVLLAQIPFVFLCWGLSILLAGKDMRDISRNLTESEREESRRLAESYGTRTGLFIAGPFAIVFGFLHVFLGIRTYLPYLLLFCLLMIVALPFMVLHRRKMKVFMYSTDYAKQQRCDRESANHASDGTRQPADRSPRPSR